MATFELPDKNRDLAIRDALVKDMKIGWDPFWQVFGPVITSIVRSFGLSEVDTQDVLQDIIVSLLNHERRALKKWDPERSSLDIYIRIIAKCKCLDFLRSGYYRYYIRRMPASIDIEDPKLWETLENPLEDPSEAMHRIRLMDLLETTIQEMLRNSKLRQVDAHILHLKISGLKVDEIAVLLDMTSENVSVRFSRMKGDLAAQLKQNGIDLSDIGDKP